MCQGWVAVLDDDEYLTKFSAPKWIGYNVKSKIKQSHIPF